jgi:hypothetical protein
MPAPTQASVRVLKQFTYRGSTKTWSNRYYLNSSTGPPDTSHWNTLFDNIVAAEKLCMAGNNTIVECIGYQGGSDLPIASKSYSQAGTWSATGTECPGDCAGMIRYATTQRTSRNHPIYLYNWYHGVWKPSTSGSPDTIVAALVTLMQTYGNAWVTGFSDGTTVYKKAGPRGAVAQSATVLNTIRHRDFLN